MHIDNNLHVPHVVIELAQCMYQTSFPRFLREVLIYLTVNMVNGIPAQTVYKYNMYPIRGTQKILSGDICFPSYTNVKLSTCICD